MDRYFYSVEDNGKEKEIHISGNVYFNDADETETDHRIATWKGFYLSLDEVKDLLDDDCFFDYINERVRYLEDLTKEEALEMCNIFWDGKPGTELHISEVTQDTPCGYYWFEVGVVMDYEMETNRDIEIKEDIENILRQMCFGRSNEWSEGMISRIYKTNVIYDNCIDDCISIDEDMIVSALMEIVYKDYECFED